MNRSVTTPTEGSERVSASLSRLYGKAPYQFSNAVAQLHVSRVYLGLLERFFVVHSTFFYPKQRVESWGCSFIYMI
jgi:hypothetical protein